MMKTINRIGRMLLWELFVLIPALLLATERLSRSGWDGVAQVSLLYGGLFGALLVTTLMAIVFRRMLDRLSGRIKWFSSWIDGQGVLGYMLFIAFVVFDCILHPWVPGLLIQAICRMVDSGS